MSRRSEDAGKGKEARRFKWIEDVIKTMSNKDPESPNSFFHDEEEEEERQELRANWREPDLDALVEQFHGTQFRKLIEEHLRKSGPLDVVLEALKGSLTRDEQVVASTFFQRWVHASSNRSFWRQDCGVVFRKICEDARNSLEFAGLEANDKIVFEFFQIVAVGFAFIGMQHKGLRRFMGIRKSFWSVNLRPTPCRPKSG